jgi:hypothetical protein
VRLRLVLAALCTAILARSAAAVPIDGRRLHTADGRLTDHRGREITLRGVNARVRGVFDVTFMNEPLVLNADAEQKLRDFHVRIAKAIRRVDKRHLVVFEPNVTRNLTNQAPIPSTPFPDRRAVYAPHIYTYVFDGKTFTGDASALVASMEAAATEASAWGTPLLVGEYGIEPDASTGRRLDHDISGPPGSAARALDVLAVGGDQLGPLGSLRRRERRAGRRARRPDDGAVAHVHPRRPRPGPRSCVRRDGQHASPALPRAGRSAARAVAPPRRYPRGFTLRCDDAAVAAKPDPVTGAVTFRCGRARGDHVVALAPTS